MFVIHGSGAISGLVAAGSAIDAGAPGWAVVVVYVAAGNVKLLGSLVLAMFLAEGQLNEAVDSAAEAVLSAKLGTAAVMALKA